MLCDGVILEENALKSMPILFTTIKLRIIKKSQIVVIVCLQINNDSGLYKQVLFISIVEFVRNHSPSSSSVTSGKCFSSDYSQLEYVGGITAANLNKALQIF